MKQTVEQVQGRAKANKGPKTGECCLEEAAKAEAAQVASRAAADAANVTRLEVAAKSAEAAKDEVTRADAEKARLRAAEEHASRLEVAVTTAMQAWDATITAMAGLKAPGIVAEAALTAMRMAAGTWGFEAPEAVEAVMLKIVSRTPLPFINPQLWLLLSIIRAALQITKCNMSWHP